MVRSPIQGSGCNLAFIFNRLIHYSSIGLFAIGISSICPLASNANSFPVPEAEQPEHKSTLQNNAMLLAQGPPVLQMGSRGKPVSELQATLRRLGHYSGAIDGIYGESTAQAVARFQQSVGLRVDGITGSATWNRLYLAVRNLPQPSTESDPLIRRPVLQLGSQGNEVSELQAALKLLGYYSGEVDGLYGENIATAVARFQKDSGLRVDGVTGPETWNRLFPPTPTPRPPTPAVATAPATCSCPPGAGTAPSNAGNPAASSPPERPQNQPVTLPILRPGMRGPAIVNLQERLKVLGVFKGGSDGVFGPATEAGVRAVQRNANLNPDGIVGPATWNALLR